MNFSAKWTIIFFVISTDWNKLEFHTEVRLERSLQFSENSNSLAE